MSPHDIIAAIREANQPPDVLDVAELCRRLPWGRKTILKMIHDRRIPALKLEGKWVISWKNYQRAIDCDFAPPTGRAMMGRAA